MVLNFGAEEQGFIAKNVNNSRKYWIGLGPQDHTTLKIFFCAFFHVLLLSFKEKKEELGYFRGQTFKIIKRPRILTLWIMNIMHGEFIEFVKESWILGFF